MPKGKIYKIDVNKDVFKKILYECDSSIIKLGDCKEIDCTERTIRRALNEDKGKMTPRFLDQIAQHLNVDPRLLSGELHKRADDYKDEYLKKMYLAQLTPQNYPYYRKRKSDLEKQPFDELLEHILSLFDISFSQFDFLDFESKYQLQHDVLEVLIPVIRKYFTVDAYGRKDMPNLEKTIHDLDNYHDNYYSHLYADVVLRKEFLKNPPIGKTKAQISKMSTDEIISLHLHITDDKE